jgi:hypothetical protein
MTFSNFWYCVRLELGREKTAPAYGQFMREAVKTILLWKPAKRVDAFPKTELVFVIITENHLQHFRPVAQALVQQNHSFSVLYTSETLFQQYGKEWPGVSFSIHSFVSQWQSWQALLFQSALLFRNLFSTVPQTASIIRFAKPAFLFNKAMLRLLRGVPRKVILFKAEGFQANAVLLACRELQLPSFAIQHGLIGDSAQVSSLIVDTYLVWSALFKKRLKKWAAGCKVMITGNAAYDAVFQKVITAGPQSLPIIPIQILVLPNSGDSHTPLDQVYLLLDAAVAFAKQNPEGLVTVKPHPADHAEKVRRYLLPHLDCFQNLRLLDRIHAIPFDDHHIVAINNSGAGMEACIWGRPLLVFASTWESVAVKQYVDSGVAEFVDSAERFASAVSKIQNGYAAYQLKCKHFVDSELAHHGVASKRIVEALTC